MAYPRYQRARDFKFQRISSTLTMNSTTWANMPTLSTLVLAAQVGDVIEAITTSRWESEAVAGFLDAVTEVGGSPVGSFGNGGAALTSTTGDGVRPWVGASGVASTCSGSAFRTLTAADISNGTVTVRWRYRTASATNKTMFVDSTGGIFFAVKNLGPADPN